MHMRFPYIVFVLACAVLLALPLVAQSPNGTINGLVLDPASRVIAAADILVINDATSVKYLGRTNNEGIYIVANLPPGPYRLQVSKVGFKTIIKPDITLNVQDALAINFTLPVGAAFDTVTVEGGASLVNTESAAVSTVVDRQFAENLPMNGRSFQTLIQLTPGIVVTPYSFSDNGQFSVDGQRASANYWMVDGVSANVGIGTSQYSAGNGLSGANAGLSILGGTNSLVSVDAMQEFRIQTSTYAPEFGRTPGGQISISTRSGTNQIHGTAFDYLRNDVFDANNWFSDFNSLPKPMERQNDFGGTLGGPIIKDKTFFFFSYEGLRLRLPENAESLVPDLNARQSAVTTMQPYLSAFPLPTPGTPDDLATGIAHFNTSYSNRATLDAYNLRIDHTLKRRINLFGRYDYSPSVSNERGVDSGSLNSVTTARIALQTATAGMTWTILPTVFNDLRFNYSRTNSASRNDIDSLGGAVPLAALPFPKGLGGDNGVLFLLWAPLSPYYGPVSGPQGHNLQRQINLVDDLNWQKGSHSFKFGIDFRRLTPVFANPKYFQEVEFADVPSSLTGNTLFGAISAERIGSFLFRNLGMFAQDTWKVAPRLTLTYGFRWDVDFAPISSPALLSVTGFNLNDLSNLALAPSGTPPFSTRYGSIAPRLGVAYQLPVRERFKTVLRGGLGTFYDLATSEVGNSIFPNFYPFGATTFSFGSTFPLNNTLSTPPAITPSSLQSSGAGAVFDPHLKLPYTLQWNVAIEQALGAQQALSITYVGAAGRRLMQTALVNHPDATFSSVSLIANAATSDYDSLQLQFRRRLVNGLQATASYAWSHSIDTASSGSLYGDQANALAPASMNENRGPSDFDIRNSFSSGITYEVPKLGHGTFLNGLLGNWAIDNIFQARSASPITASVTGGGFGALGIYNVVIRPDLVPGQSPYLYGSECEHAMGPVSQGGKGELQPGQSCPGGKALNPNAYVAPPPGKQGDLARNALRGFGAWQWDFAVHRDFVLHESTKLQFRAEMFNFLNHPNFAPPVSDISNPAQFGLSTQTLGSFLAGGNIGSGALSPLYQIGGPRSIQFALKLFF